MISIGKLRRSYFAMCRKLDFDTQARYDLHASLGLPVSSRDFAHEQWDVVVARLQQLTGREGVRYGKPQLKHDRRSIERIPDGFDVTASERQLAYIRDLSDRITWRHPDGPAAGLRALIVKTWPKARGEFEKEQWARHSGSIALLDRDHANKVIAMLRRMAAREPAHRSGEALPCR